MWPRGLLNAAHSKAETGSCSSSTLGRSVHSPGKAILFAGCLNAVFPKERYGLSLPKRGWSAQLPSQAPEQGLAQLFFFFFLYDILSHLDTLKKLSGRYSLDHPLCIPRITDHYTLLLFKTFSDPSTRHFTPSLRS